MFLRSLSIIILITVTLSTVSSTGVIHKTESYRSPTNSPLGAVNGQQFILAILVKFPDRTNNTSQSQINNYFATVNSYYNEDSYHAITFAPILSPSPIKPWYSLPQNIAYYGADTVTSDNQLVTDSLQAAYNAGVNLSNYKFAVIIHAGNDEALTHSLSDIHSFTIPGFNFQPVPLTSYKISTSVVAESDPPGVYCHEFGHLLGLPDLYDLTQKIDPTNNFIGYWDIMALGEWDPNTGNPLDPSPGSFPAQHSAWSKIRLGWIPSSRIVTVDPGEEVTVALHNIELPNPGNQSIQIPIGVNSDGSLTYYLLEMRAKLGLYDRYLPFATGYPDAGLLIYKVNESMTPGHGNIQLVNAHPGSDLSNAPFGPCNSPCTSNNAFSDSQNFVNIIVTATSPTIYTVVVDRTSSPLLLLQVDTPTQGTLVSVDGVNRTSDSSKQVRLTVHYGPHLLFIQNSVPLTISSTSFHIGLMDTFAAWNDGNTANPRWISVSGNTVTSATYRIIIEPSLATAATATLVLGILVVAVELSRRRKSRLQFPNHSDQNYEKPGAHLLPGNNSLLSNSNDGNESAKNS